MEKKVTAAAELTYDTSDLAYTVNVIVHARTDGDTNILWMTGMG